MTNKNMSFEEKGIFAKKMARTILESQGIETPQDIEILDGEVDGIIASTNLITSSSVSALTERGDMTKDAMDKLGQITDVAQQTSRTFKKKTFLGIPMPMFNKNRLKNVDLKLRDAQTLITDVSSDLDDFEHILKGDTITLSQSISELNKYSEQIGDNILLSNMIVDEINIETKNIEVDGTEFALKLNQVNNKIAIKEKKRAIINTAVLQLKEQRREAMAIIENVKDTKQIVPLMMSVSALIAATGDTQISIQDSIEALNEKANEMFIENIDAQMELSKKVRKFNSGDKDKEVISKISEFVQHIDKNKAELLSTRKDIEDKIIMLSSVNEKLGETINMTDELQKVAKLS